MILSNDQASKKIQVFNAATGRTLGTTPPVTPVRLVEQIESAFQISLDLLKSSASNTRPILVSYV